MKRIAFFIFLILSLPVVFAGCSAGSEHEVLAVEITGTYHRPTCSLVNMANTRAMTVAQARTDHLKPCLRCKPDTI